MRRRLIRLLRSPQRRRADVLMAQADRARDAGQHGEAAALYVEALSLAPRAAMHVQAGHMFKEARDFEAAQRHYQMAQRLLPDDADLALQIGHFHRTVDRNEAAAADYARALVLAPGWAEPVQALAALEHERAEFIPGSIPTVPTWEMLPEPMPTPMPPMIDRIVLRRLGTRREAVPEGNLAFLSGVEAIRGLCFSDRPLVEATVLIDGAPVHREPVETRETGRPALWKTVFNLWIDLSGVAPGLHRLDIVLADAGGWTRRHFERIVIAPPGEDDGLVPSDAVVQLATGDPRGVEAQVRAQPTVARSARALRPPAPERILVMRIDQLGDMVVSIPALRRLRALFPDARITGLLGSANADLARSLGLFDEVIVADVPDDPVRRRRTMEPEQQHDLAARLSGERFDIAIDLATSGASRPLLRLTGARLTFGFDDAASPWLDGGLSGAVRDRHGGGEASPQSARILALVERLGTLFAAPAPIIERQDLDPALLAPLGLATGERFVVLHAGARIAWSRWPGFPDLARALLARHDLRVVLLTEGTELARMLPADLAAEDRLLAIDRRLPFDLFDALLSFAAAFVGNDSGPKHLAALRGTPVVAIHCARVGWAEWGQEQTGVILSRRVPCAGCAIFHDPDECGKEIACVADITVDEVLTALEPLLAGGRSG